MTNLSTLNNFCERNCICPVCKVILLNCFAPAQILEDTIPIQMDQAT